MAISRITPGLIQHSPEKVELLIEIVSLLSHFKATT